MGILSKESICLGAAAESKRDAIRQCGKLLVDVGCVVPQYVDGMLAREEIMSTYLGNGVAIPHGQFDNRGDILRTGISVLQIPAGIEWEPGERAYLIIGIAALIHGLFGLVRKSGFFFGAADGISRFKSLLANRPAPGESLADNYAAHIGRYSSDTAYRAYLAIGAALIAVSALSAML